MALLKVDAVVRNIAASFALNNISFELNKGQKLGVAGATGSGKSTLLKIIAGLDDADEGAAYFEEKKIRGPKYRLIPGQPGIAYLSQHYELRNHQRMEEILSYANTMSDEKANQLFEICKISHLLKRTTFQLSGGEKQRIALARLLLTAPRLLILDEPFSNLDLIHKTILKQILNDIGKELELTCIIASHDPLDLLSWADKMIIIKDGKLLQEDAPKDIYFKPTNEYAGALLGKYNLLDQKTSAFFTKKDWNGKQLFVRPENIQVSDNKGNGLEAKISDIVFWGNYYELKLQFKKHTITAVTTDIQYKTGQTVYIQLKETNVEWAV